MSRGIGSYPRPHDHTSTDYAVFDSAGAHRHANFGTGQIDPQLLVAVVKAAGAR
jgi:hypothetical protein